MNVCVRVQVKHTDSRGTSTLWSPSRTVLNNWDPWTAAGIGRLTLSETVFERISRVKEHQHEHQISLCSTTTLYCSPDQCYLLYLSAVFKLWLVYKVLQSPVCGQSYARIFPIEKKNTLTRPWQSRRVKMVTQLKETVFQFTHGWIFKTHFADEWLFIHTVWLSERDDIRNTSVSHSYSSRAWTLAACACTHTANTVLFTHPLDTERHEHSFLHSVHVITC